eukprot:557796-Rhodomonas_salina.3
MSSSPSLLCAPTQLSMPSFLELPMLFCLASYALLPSFLCTTGYCDTRCSPKSFERENAFPVQIVPDWAVSALISVQIGPFAPGLCGFGFDFADSAEMADGLVRWYRCL